MNRFTRAVVACAVGSLTTNVLHELARRTRSDAPRIDLLGMQALAKSLNLLKLPAPTGRTLYGATLAADLITNSVYFSLVGAASRERSIVAGAAIGVLAGCGAVMLPPQLGLATQLTNRTPFTRAMSVALYTAGGLAAGYTQRALSSATTDDPLL
jgi:hypothetical protein